MITTFLKNILVFIGFLAASLSVLAVAQGAFDYKFGQTITLTLIEYNELTNLIVGGAEPRY